MQIFDAILPVLATALFLGGLGGLCILLVQILRLARLSRREKKYHLVGWQSDARRALIVGCALVAIGLGNMVFWTNGQLRLYTPTSVGMPVGMVSVLKPDGPRTLPRLVYSTTDEDGNQAFEVFPVRDARFRLTGERIRWSNRLAGLGLTDFFKVTRLEFAPGSIVTDSVKAPFYVDVRQGSSDLFKRLRQYQSFLPFVDIDTLVSTPYQADFEFSAYVYLDSATLILR